MGECYEFLSGKGPIKLPLSVCQLVCLSVGQLSLFLKNGLGHVKLIFCLA